MRSVFLVLLLLFGSVAQAQTVRMRWYKSSIDGQDQPYAFVPPAKGGTPPYGLVVGLHGHYGGPGAYCALVLGGARAPSDFAVACPYGYGDTAFRFLGEQDLFEVLRRVKEELPIDEDRVYLTGASDGGVAAYELGLHYPDRWAASMALAAYGSMTIFPSVGRQGHRDWELPLIQYKSATSWVANAEHLPFFIANGAKDFWEPTPDETVAYQLQQRGYVVENHLHADLGHNTWTRTYAGGAAFDWFRGRRRKKNPDSVTFRTADPRYNNAWWIQELELADPIARFSAVEGRRKDGSVSITTSGVRAFRLADTSASVIVDGQRLPPPGATRRMRRGEDGRWAWGSVAASGQVKRAGLAGPLDDFRSKPTIFVFGEGYEDLAAAERAHWSKGLRVRYPLRSAADVSAEARTQASLVLLGSCASNALICEVERRQSLPLSVDGSAVRVGSQRFSGKGVGYRMIYPSPFAADQYVVIVGGVDRAGVEVAAGLPELQPDWVVADANARAATGKRGMVLGPKRRVLAAGFFDREWRLRPTRSSATPR